MTRLPNPGSDDNTWGNLLNDFLTVSHNADGTIKVSALPLDTDNTLAADSDIKIATQKAVKSYVDNSVSAGAVDATSSVKGVVKLTGDLGGTADSPTVPGLASKAADNAVVHLSGTETIAGPKTFNASTLLDKGNQVFDVRAYGAVGDGMTNDTTAINAAITAANAAGGGVVLIPGGATYKATAILPKNNVTVRAYGATIDNFAPHVTGIFRHTDNTNGLTNFALEGGTFTGGQVWYSRGSVNNCRFENNRFYGATGVDSFIMFFDAFSPNPYNTIKNNLFSGQSGGWDMLGSGALDYGEISFNRFENGNAQGWGITSCNYARCIGNVFYMVGNPVGFEGITIGCVVEGNVVYRSGNIKLALVGGSDVSRYNKVLGNTLVYSGGIEDGQGYEDTISGNSIIRSAQKGIFGAFERCKLSDNELFETNYTNSAVTVNGSGQTDGGIVLLNNATIATPTGNQVQNNKIYTTRTNFTHPDGSTNQGFTGGILIDTSYVNTYVSGNSTDNTYGTVIDSGSGTSLLHANGSNFGIGTASASANLYVNSNSNTGAGGIFVKSNNTASLGIEVQQDGGNNKAAYFHSNANAHATNILHVKHQNGSDSGVTVKIENAGSGDTLQVFNDATQAFTIRKNGNVGIGKVPGTALDVNGTTTSTAFAGPLTGNVTGTADSANAIKSATTTVNVNAATAPTNGQVLTATSGIAATWQTPTTASDATTGSKGIVQLTNDFGGTATAPTVLATHLASALPVNQGGTGSTSQNFVDLTTNQTSISGNKTFTGTNVGIASDNGLKITGTGGGWSAQRLLFGGDASGWQLKIGSINNSAVISTPAVVISDNGRLGIGATSLQNTLSVASGGNIAVEMVSPTGMAAALVAGGTLTLGQAYYYVVTALDGVGETVQSAEVTATPSGGNQAINVTWTAVAGAATYKVYRSTTSGTYTTPALIKSIAGGPPANSYSDTGADALGAGAPPANTTAYVNKITANGNMWHLGGNVGIGTAAPTANLYVNSNGGSGATGIFVKSNNTASLGIEVQQDGGNNKAMYLHSNANAHATNILHVKHNNGSDSGNTFLLENAGSGDTMRVMNGATQAFTIKPANTVTVNAGLIVKRTTVADTGYAVLVSDHIVAYTSLTASRTVTLPTAVGATAQEYIIKDESGSATTFNIVIATTSSQTIDGGAASAKNITTNYGVLRVYSNGANWVTY